MTVGILRRFIERVWWGDGWVRSEEPRVEPHPVRETTVLATLGGDMRSSLAVADGASIMVGDWLVAGADGRVSAGERNKAVGRALEDFEYSPSDGVWCGKAIL